MNATSDYAAIKPQAGVSPLGNPWVQLIIGIICMACVANLQSVVHHHALERNYSLPESTCHV